MPDSDTTVTLTVEVNGITKTFNASATTDTECLEVACRLTRAVATEAETWVYSGCRGTR